MARIFPALHASRRSLIAAMLQQKRASMKYSEIFAIFLGIFSVKKVPYQQCGI